MVIAATSSLELFDSVRAEARQGKPGTQGGQSNNLCGKSG
jgi:hypothetical protein